MYWLGFYTIYLVSFCLNFKLCITNFCIDVVQYKAEIYLPNDFFVGINDSMKAISQLILDSNNFLSGSNIGDTSFFYIEILTYDELISLR